MPDPRRVALPQEVGPERWDDEIERMLYDMAPGNRPSRFHVHGRKGFVSLSREMRPAKIHPPLFRHVEPHPIYSVPPEAFLRRLADMRVLEVGAGSGAFALILAAAGCDVVATDPSPWGMGHDRWTLLPQGAFSERHREGRSRPFTKKPLPGRWGSLGGPIGSSAFSRGRAGPACMSFQATSRPRHALGRPPSFYPVAKMTASEAVAAYPDRCVVIMMPDPDEDCWVSDLAATLPRGTVLFLFPDYGTTIPDGYQVKATFPMEDPKRSFLRGVLELVRA